MLISCALSRRACMCSCAWYGVKHPFCAGCGTGHVAEEPLRLQRWPVAGGISCREYTSALDKLSAHAGDHEGRAVGHVPEAHWRLPCGDERARHGDDALPGVLMRKARRLVQRQQVTAPHHGAASSCRPLPQHTGQACITRQARRALPQHAGQACMDAMACRVHTLAAAVGQMSAHAASRLPLLPRGTAEAAMRHSRGCPRACTQTVAAMRHSRGCHIARVHRSCCHPAAHCTLLRHLHSMAGAAALRSARGSMHAMRISVCGAEQHVIGCAGRVASRAAGCR
jgi:hypothetical protein